MTRKTSNASPPQVPAYHCKVCGIDMAIASSASHLAGKKHRNQCAVLSVVGDRPGTLGTGGSVPEAISSTTAAGNEYSGICNEGMPEGVEKHTASAPHTNSAKHNKRQPSARTKYCGFCGEEMPGGVDKHMASMPHRNTAKSANQAAPPAAGHSQPANLNPTVIAFTLPLRSKKPPSTDSKATYHCDICSRNVFTALREQHLKGLIHAEAMAMATLAAKKGWTAPGEESIRKQPGSTISLVASGTEAGPAGYETNEREEGGGKEVIGEDQIQGIIAAGGASDEKRKSVEESVKAGDGSIAASGEEYARDTDFTTTVGRQHIPQPDNSAPPSPFTLQSQYSTAHLYCDSCVRQLNTPTGFVAHMAGKTHQRNMEAKIASDQEEMSIREEKIATEAAILGVSSESVGRKELVLQTRPLSATQPEFLMRGALERYLARPSMQMHIYPHLLHDESKASPDVNQLPDKLAAQWYCNSCAEYVNVDTRDEHLGSLLHLLGRGEIPGSDAGPGVIRTDPAAQKVTPDTTPQTLAMPERPVTPLGHVITLMELENHFKQVVHPIPRSRDAPDTVATETHVGDVRPSSLSPSRDTHNANNRVPCKKQFKNISTHLLPRAYLHKRQPPLGKLYCSICSQEYPEIMDEMHRTPAWDCELCGTRTHTRFRLRHLGSPAHTRRVAVGLAAGGEDHVCDAPVEETEFDNLDFSTLWDKTPKDIASDLLTKAHLEMRCSVIDVSEDDEGGTGIEGADAEEGSLECGVFDRLNELVRSQPLEKNPELHVTTETEPEIWNCTMCEKDMPPAMRKTHETDPSHIGRLEKEGHDAAGRTQQQTRVIPPEPGVAVFRCLVCLTTYGLSGRHLHSTPPWHCDSCDMTVHTGAKQDHLSTVSHRLNESAPGKKHTEPTFTPTSKNTFFCLPCHRNLPASEEDFHISPPYYCTLCGLVMHTDTRDIHEWSLSHSRAVAAATVIPEKKSKRFNCQTCDNNFPVAVQPFHRSRAWACELCKVTVHMDWIGAHLASEEHVTRENDQQLQEDVEEGGVSIS